MLEMLDKITLTNAHGTFTTTASGLDLEIARRLPASPNDLREAMGWAVGGDIDYSDVHDVAAFLIMFADMDYPA
jgi:hypothetical protein